MPKMKKNPTKDKDTLNAFTTLNGSCGQLNSRIWITKA
jgi:hypothetical protein